MNIGVFLLTLDAVARLKDLAGAVQVIPKAAQSVADQVTSGKVGHTDG